MRRGGCAPVPFQVDEKDTNDKYVFPEDQRPERDGLDLDADDEVCKSKEFNAVNCLLLPGTPGRRGILELRNIFLHPLETQTGDLLVE